MLYRNFCVPPMGRADFELCSVCFHIITSRVHFDLYWAGWAPSQQLIFLRRSHRFFKVLRPVDQYCDSANYRFSGCWFNLASQFHSYCFSSYFTCYFCGVGPILAEWVESITLVNPPNYQNSSSYVETWEKSGFVKLLSAFFDSIV